MNTTVLRSKTGGLTCYYSRDHRDEHDFGRTLLGGVILLIIAPLFVSLAGGSLLPFGLMLLIEALGAFWGVLRFRRLPQSLIVVDLSSPIPAVRRWNRLKKAA